MDEFICTYVCKSCNTINRVKSPNRLGGWWKCGKVILYREEIFYEELIINVRKNMTAIYEEICRKKYPVFAQKKINELETKMNYNQSKIENWLDHLGYLKDGKQKKIIESSYQPDLEEIQNMVEKISTEMKDKRWLKNKLNEYNFIRRFIVSIANTLKAVSTLLSFFGFEGLLDSFKLLLLEE